MFFYRRALGVRIRDKSILKTSILAERIAS